MVARQLLLTYGTNPELYKSFVRVRILRPDDLPERFRHLPFPHGRENEPSALLVGIVCGNMESRLMLCNWHNEKRT